MSSMYNYIKQISSDQLTLEIINSDISKQLERIDTIETSVNIYFREELTSEELSMLDTIIQNHEIQTIQEINANKIATINQYIMNPETANLAGATILLILLPQFNSTFLDQIIEIIENNLPQ